MLTANLQKKLTVLKFLLYSVVISILLLTVVHGLGMYQYIKSLSATSVIAWVAKRLPPDYHITVKNLKIDFRRGYLDIQAQGIKFDNLNSAHNSVATKLAYEIDKITASINIFKIIFAGKIRLQDLVATDVVISHNQIYPIEKIGKITGILRLGLNRYGIDHKINIVGSFKSNNQINFNLGATLIFTNNSVNLIKFNLDCYESELRNVIRLLPENFIGFPTINWIDQALLQGRISSAELTYFAPKEFNLKITFKEVFLKYGKDWPEIQNLAAKLYIIDNNLEIKMIDEKKPATIFQQPINKLVASIKNIDSIKPSSLYIYGDMFFPGVQGIKFLTTINKGKLLNNLDNIDLNGKINMVLNLEIPLDKNSVVPVKYHGICKTRNAAAKIFGMDMAQLSTNVIFDNNSITTEDFSAKVLGVFMPMHLQIKEKELKFISPNLKFQVKLEDEYRKVLLDDWRELVIENLLFGDTACKDIKLLKTLNNINIYLEEKHAKGNIVYHYTIPVKDIPAKLDIDFEKLKINSNNLGVVNKIYSLFLSLAPKIKFNCTSLFIDNFHLGKINFAGNIIMNDNNIKKLEIINAELATPNMKAISSAKIYFNQKLSKVNATLSGNLLINNLGGAFRDLDIDSKFVTNGQGDIDFSIEYSPVNSHGFSWRDTVAEFNLRIKSGFILGLDPGIGRIFGLLSVENIPKRLALDFSDLTNRGFSFDSLIGKVCFKQEKFILNNINIIGPAANILLEGSIDSVSKQVDLLAAVTPKTGAALPLAAAVASGNPIVGAAMWLFDYASGAKLSKTKIKKYKITGIVDKLIIHPIDL